MGADKGSSQDAVGGRGTTASPTDGAVPAGVRVWRLRTELRDLYSRSRELREEIDAIEQAEARERLKSLGGTERLVLAALAAGYHQEYEWSAYTFSGLQNETGLSRLQVSRACRALRRLGFAKHEINLWTEDGEMAGAGYRATRLGYEHDWNAVDHGTGGDPSPLRPPSDTQSEPKGGGQ